MGRHGAGPLRARAGGAGGAGPLRCAASRGAGRLSPRRHVRPHRFGGGPRRSEVEAARHLRARVRAHRPVGERRDPAERGGRAQPRGDRGRASRRGARSRGRAPVRGGAGVAHRGVAGRGGDGRGVRARIPGRGGARRAQRVLGRAGLEHRRRQRRPPGGERPGGGHRRARGPLRGRGGTGAAAEDEPRLPQRDGGAGPRRPRGGPLRRPVLDAVDPLRQQPHRAGGGAGRDPRRGLLASPGARAGGVPRLRRDRGRSRGGHDRRDRPARGARSHGVPRLAGDRTRHRRGRAAHPGEPPPALRLLADPGGRRRLRRCGRAGVRSGPPDLLRRAVLPGGAPPHRSSELPVPAPPPLGRSPEAAAPGGRPPVAGGAARIAAWRGHVRDRDLRLGPGVGERSPGVRPGRGTRRDVRHDGRDGAVGRRRGRGGPRGLPVAQPDDLPGGGPGRGGRGRRPEAPDRVRRLREGIVVAPLRGVQPGRGRRRLDPAPRRTDGAGRVRAARRGTGGPRRRQGPPRAGRRRLPLSEQGEHPGGPRSVVPAPQGHLVGTGRGGGRGVPAGLPRRVRSGPPSDPARRLLPVRARSARPGPGRGQVDLHAVRVGSPVARGAAAGTRLLPRAHAGSRRRRGSGGDGGRLSGSGQGRPPNLRPERGSPRRGGRLHDEAGDAGRDALGVERGQGPPVRGRLAGPGPRRVPPARRFPGRSGSDQRPDRVLPGLPGGRGCRSRRTSRPARGSRPARPVPCPHRLRRARLAAHRGLGSGTRRSAPGPERRAGASAPVPAAARAPGRGRGARCAAGGRPGRRDRLGGPVAGRCARRAPCARGASPRPSPARLERGRSPPSVRRRAGRGAPGPHGPALAPLRRRRAGRGGSLSDRPRRAGRHPDARRRGRRRRVGPSGRKAASGAGDRGRHRLGHRAGPGCAPGRALRLPVHGHIGRVLRRSGVAFRGERRADRIPGPRHRGGSGRPGLRPARLRPRHRRKRPPRHPGPRRDPRPLSCTPRPVGSAHRARARARPDPPGPHLRAAGRLVAVRRRLPAGPRARGSRRLVPGAWRRGLRGRAGRRRGRVRRRAAAWPWNRHRARSGGNRPAARRMDPRPRP